MASTTDDVVHRVAGLDALLAPLDRSDAPGFVAAVSVGDRVVYRRAAGLASVAAGVANTHTTRMRIGSTSKQLTALLILLLAEDGSLDLDDPVRRYLPELPRYPVDPTLRQLLNHTSGVRCHIADAFLVEAGQAVRPPGESLRTLLRQSRLNFAPGSRWLYSNGGYHLLSQISSRISGLSFGELLRRRVLSPLGMARTMLMSSDLEVHGDVAALHVQEPSGRYRSGIFPTQDVLGEGGVVSTADDMLRWLAALRRRHAIATDRSWAAMSQPLELGGGVSVPYGLGLLVSRLNGITMLRHAGAVVGGSAQAITAPEAALDIVVLANGGAVNAGALASRLLAHLLGEDVSPAPSRPGIAEHAAMAGRDYVSAEGLVVGFRDVAGTLGVSLFGNPPIPLRCRGNAYELAFDDAGVGPLRFHDAVDWRTAAPEQLRASEGGASTTLRVLEPVASTRGGAIDLTGTYRCEDLGADAMVSAARGQGEMRVSSMHGGCEMRLTSLSDTVWRWQTVDAPMALVGTLDITSGAGRVQAFRMNAWSSRGLEYRRIDGCA